MINLNESRILIDNVELVLVRQSMVTSVELPDRFVILILKSRVPVPMVVCSIVTSNENRMSWLCIGQLGS